MDEAENLLQDSSNVRWTETELLQGVNTGCIAVCSFKPDAYVVSESVALVEGIVQSLPVSGHFLQDVICNMGTDGSTFGKAVTLIDRKILDCTG